MPLNIEGVFREHTALCDLVVRGEGLAPALRRLALIAFGGMAIYGFVIGLQHSMPQATASAIKVPLLFLCTLVVTLPAFHFIGLHAGSRLRFFQTLVIIMNGVATTGVLMAAFAPIALFFLLSHTGYHFLVLLHFMIVGFCSVAGVMSVRRATSYIATTHGEGFTEGAEWCIHAWMVVYALVGSQLAWMLRPFLNAQEDFALLRSPGGNFFSAVFAALVELLK